MTTTPEFSCHPVRAYTQNPDGTPSTINECPLEDARWIGIYRTDPDHETTDKLPSEWILDLPIEGDPRYTLKVAEGLCELLNGVTPAEALHNPKLHILFD